MRYKRLLEWVRNMKDRADAIFSDSSNMKKDLGLCLDAIETLSKALEFYAQRTNLYGEQSSHFCSDFENYKILADKGEIARVALESVFQKSLKPTDSNNIS